jgi:hypothetical protein
MVRYWVVKMAREDTNYRHWLRKNGKPQPEGTNHKLVKQRPTDGDRCFYFSTVPSREMRALGEITKTDSVRGWRFRAFIRPATGEFTSPLSLKQLRTVRELRKLAFLNPGYPATFYSVDDKSAALLYQLAILANPLYKDTWTDIPQVSRRASAAFRRLGSAVGSSSSISEPDRAKDGSKAQVLVVRKGQPAFRKLLLAAAGMRCEVTGCHVPSLLDACHIRGYSLGGRYSLRNGLLLRKDIHALLDSGLLRIEPETRRLKCANALHGTEYGKLDGKRLARRLNGDDPSEGALRHLWRQATKSARAS